MKQFLCKKLVGWGKNLWHSFLGSITFYTIIPIPRVCNPEFQRIARWAPLIGLLIGGLLGLFDAGLHQLGIPLLTRSALVIALWIALTGGLHLDGVIDTADGLAVFEQKQRLKVMKDSVTGAFGVMAAVVVLLLKTAALSDLNSYRWFGLMISAGWGRWGQVVAIACYTYLKPTGKGVFHKQSFRSPQDILLGFLLLLGFSFLWSFFGYYQWWIAFYLVMIGFTLSILTGIWFYLQLGGHTGDTYGAIVEWTETLCLCLFTALL